MEARELPSGTVTLLFTDIEGSTRLLQELGRDAYVRALTDHRRLLRKAFTAHGGVEVEMQGDSFHYAFGSAGMATAAALAGRDALAGHAWEHAPVRVRMGLHSGEPAQVDGLYAGLVVHRAARVMSVAHGGQVVVSHRTGELLAEDGGFALLDLGEHRLKDFQEPQRLYQVAPAGRPHVEFPPLRSLHVANVPRPADRLVGRDAELAEVVELLRGGGRLVTLTGPGGTGKTRLAIAAAGELAGAFPGGVHFVPLASIHDPALLPTVVAQALGLREAGSRPPLEIVAEHVGVTPTLLVLDNFEQIVSAAPDVSELLAGAPSASILVTSREPLRVAGERVYPVPPLPEADAVALFRERAAAVTGELDLGGDEAAAVASICARLDGLPLAIELAAARSGVLAPRALVERLDRSLDLLTGGRRDADERQRTLRSTIAWSDDLLEPAQRRALARLAVFPAGFSLDAAEQICGAGLEELTALAEQSLLRREPGGTEPRFRFLRVIREYALDRLAESGEAEEVQSRHAAWALALAEEADAGYRSDDAAAWLRRAEAHHDDFRAALRWAEAGGRSELLLDLVVALSVLWQAHGHLLEARRWFDAALTGATEDQSERLLNTLQEASSIAYRAGDYDRVADLAERQLELARRAGHERGVVYALTKLAGVAFERGDRARARELHEQAVSTARAAADDRALMGALSNLGNLELLEAPERAAELFAEAHHLARSQGRLDTLAATLFNVGFARVLAGETAAAADSFRESLGLAHGLGDREGIAYVFVGLAAVRVREERKREAAVLLGAADALLESCGASLESAERELYERTARGARAALGAAYEHAVAEGRAVDADELVDGLTAGGAVRIR